MMALTSRLWPRNRLASCGPARCWCVNGAVSAIKSAFSKKDFASGASVIVRSRESRARSPELDGRGRCSSASSGHKRNAAMERPALQHLLEDIRRRLVDVVVVYKVDRLTRSLADFAKMVEVFDARGVSFVAVPQQFNTTTSMGRLTLNVLLSFAQFEREVTGERIRDKIAASKQKGIWMGGLVPIGYDVDERRLVVNQSEAETVRK